MKACCACTVLPFSGVGVPWKHPHKPPGHSKHDVEPALEVKKPGSHGVHDAELMESEYRPGLQTVREPEQDQPMPQGTQWVLLL